MEQLKTAFIGCGRIASMHAAGYTRNPERFCVVALCDTRRETAEAFADAHGFRVRIYDDYSTMLAQERPEVVSVCLWPCLHHEAVVACARFGVRAVHCEKPMAPTFGEAIAMAEAARGSGMQLTLNHQRRMLPVFRSVLDLIRSDAIGLLQRVEVYNPKNILDWGTHTIDLLFAMNGDVPARWVMGQIDTRSVESWFDVPFEYQAVAQVMFENGVWAFVQSGQDKERNLGYRVYGADGEIDVNEEPPHLQVRRTGAARLEAVRVEGSLHHADHADIAAVMRNLHESLLAGEQPELDYRKALATTEVIFAWYESSRRRARIDLPLTIRDSPLLSIVGRGEGHAAAAASDASSPIVGGADEHVETEPEDRR